jgi:drug/metabolite transporter (DMT)-like permease
VAFAMRVPRTVIVFLALALVAASQSGNIVRLARAQPIAIAAFRLLIAAVLLAPLAGGRLVSLRKLGRSERALLMLAGVALGLHLITWIAAVQHTTVANAATFFSVNPVTTALCAHLFLRERLERRVVLAAFVGLIGVAVMGVGDLRLARAHLVGDGLAVLCALFFTAYFLLGRRLRRVLDNRVYVTGLYGVASLACFATGAALGTPLWGFDGRTWLAFLLLALVPTMIGHTGFNYALKYVDAGRISALTLTEPLFAGVVAFVVWHEAITLQTALGYVLVSLAVLLVLFPPSVAREQVGPQDAA